MPRAELNLSEYKIVWLLTMFDLPTLTKIDRRNYTRFRNKLLANGFTRLQFSIYARCWACRAWRMFRADIVI